MIVFLLVAHYHFAQQVWTYKLSLTLYYPNFLVYG